MGKRVGFALLFVVAIGSAAITSRYFVLGDSAMPELLADSLSQRRAVFTLHLSLGIVAILVGPIQFFGQRLNAGPLRPQAPPRHRWLGRAYVLSCLALGATGLMLGVAAFGGPASRLRFVVLSTLLVAFTALGWRAIRRRDIRSHLRWMTRSYALVLSFVTIRLWQVLLPGGTSEPDAYAAATWLSFVPNLLVAEAISFLPSSRMRARSRSPSAEPPAAE